MSDSAIDNLRASIRYARRVYTDPAGHSSVQRRKSHGIPLGWLWRVIDWDGNTVASGETLRHQTAERQAADALATHRANLSPEVREASRAYHERMSKRRGYSSGRMLGYIPPTLAGED